MPGKCFSSTSFVHFVTRRASRRLVTSRHSSTLTLSADVANTTPSPSRDTLYQSSLSDLRDSLARAGSPSRVWAYYTNLLNFAGYERLPLEVHQEVLRRCTASSAELRVSAARRILVGNKPTDPHIHEGRFQSIIRNMRFTGLRPTLEDYHFILEQFAAVGHHVGAMHVYKELTHLDIVPRTKTFGLCLQAIAHRLDLPSAPKNRPRRVIQTRQMLADLMQDMRRYNIPFTSVNLDLTIRILKETLDAEGFTSLMKWGYGIDLSNPDCPPVEYLGVGTVSADLGVSDQSLPSMPVPQPFSTAALNTTIDMLGRLGDVSKLVQAFEVLTQPLPQAASQHRFASFDDEDDFGVSVNSNPIFTPPHATPNTTTYNILIRHICRFDHPVFARHYLLQAIWLDRQTDHALRAEVRSKPLADILAPHFSVNRGTFLSVFGHSNRDKNLGLMRWVLTKLPKFIQKKQADLQFYTNYRDDLELQEQEFLDRISEVPAEEPSLEASPTPGAAPIGELPRVQASAFLPISTLPGILRGVPLSQRARWTKVGSVFNVDLDSKMPSPPQPKYLDIDLHVEILERNVRELTELLDHVENIFGRTSQRVKERLGRRVWSGKDIYLLTDVDKRRKISRDRWRRIVHFKPRLGYNPADLSPLSLPERSGVKYFSHNPSVPNRPAPRNPAVRGEKRGGNRQFSTLCRDSSEEDLAQVPPSINGISFDHLFSAFCR